MLLNAVKCPARFGSGEEVSRSIFTSFNEFQPNRNCKLLKCRYSSFPQDFCTSVFLDRKIGRRDCLTIQCPSSNRPIKQCVESFIKSIHETRRYTSPHIPYFLSYAQKLCMRTSGGLPFSFNGLRDSVDEIYSPNNLCNPIGSS